MRGILLIANPSVTNGRNYSSQKNTKPPPEDSRELQAINGLCDYVKDLAMHAGGAEKPAAKATYEINLPVASKLQESEDMEMDGIEYEDISDTIRHNLPDLTFTQLGFSQMELEEHEQS